MSAVRRKAVVEQDGQVTIRGLPYRKGACLDVVLVADERRPVRGRMTARKLLASPLVGMWADRKDIKDSSTYARELRERAQTRGDRE